jgi:serine/threonine protein kinase
MTPEEQQRATYGYYDVEAVLGQGAMGTVYLARDRRIGRRVALKTIQLTPKPPGDAVGDGEFFARLQREAELSGSLSHPNIVTLYEAGYENDRISYLAIEYIEGEPLQTILRKRGALPVDEALKIIEEMLAGLDYAHKKGVIHRDIKPANILINAEGQVKIADFGIARPVSDSNMTRAGMLMGTPNYMAPEQVQGARITARTDLFSTGVVLYQMLTGAKPFAGQDMPEILYKIVHDNPTPMRKLQPALPEVVARFVERLMAKNPEERFESAAEALGDLRKLRDMFSSTTPMPIPLPADSLATATTERSMADAARFDRTVPTRIFVSVAAGLVLVVLFSILGISRNIKPHPTVEISRQKLLEFDEKRRIIQSAEALYAAGSYQASAQQYEEYLKRWPDSPAAVQGLQRARTAQQEFQIVEASRTSTAATGTPGQAPKKPQKKKEEDWLLQKLKSIGRKVSGDR